ncbi:MAG: prepilin-type N-terminal cleavage/methylation domain-containing protein [Candidatus Sulfotelmatobacter sp.]
MSQNGIAEKPNRTRQGGFSLIEVMIAIVVLTVGVLALIATFGTAIAATESAQEDLIARHKALDAMESIYTARNSQQIPFAAINNVASGGIFASGPQPLLCAGPVYGIVGVSGDTSACQTQFGAVCPNGGVECLVLPGPNGILGDGDDVTLSLANFTRTITFNPVLLPTGAPNTNLVAVTITVAYTKPGWPARTYTVNGLISSYH